MKTKPSDFKNYPWDSVLHKCELESIAQNIMIILARTGDTFRKLSYEEYKNELNKDGQYAQGETDFNKVIDSGYFKNADTAQLFSKEWKDKE